MNIRIALASVLCVALAGCGHRYNIRPLKHIQKNEAHFSEKKDNIELHVKKLTPSEVQEIFNKRARPALNKHSIPLLVTIKNNSTEPVIFDQGHTNLELIPAKKLEKLLSEDIGGTIFIGALAIPAIVTVTGTVVCCPALISILLIVDVFVITPFIAGSVAHSVSDAAQFNVNLSYDLKKKVYSTIVIEPNQEKSTLLFTSELQQPFTITITRERKCTTTFVVTLKESEALGEPQS